MPHRPTKIASFFLCFLLIFEQSGFAQVAGQLDISSHILSLRNSLIQDKFRPLHLRSLSYDNLNNNFQLLLDKGDPKDLKSDTIEQTTKEILNYFFVGITLPNDSFWVNLRPDSPDNIIDPVLGTTDVGKILLEADLQLKKDTAKFTSPETVEGKKYWAKLYQKAEELFGTSNITIPTLTRPWIVPGEIIIRETESNAYIYKATLKVMLEEDYLKDSATYNFKDERLKQLNEYSSQLIRELIIPKLTKEVNNAKRYAPLRQVYYSLILAQWFKQKFYGKGGLYSWLIDKKNLSGLTSKTVWSKTTYFKEYQKSFKDGEYNIQEPISSLSGKTIRSYFSGGISFIGEAINAGLGLGGRIPANPKKLELPKDEKQIKIEIKGGDLNNPGEINITKKEVTFSSGVDHLEKDQPKKQNTAYSSKDALSQINKGGNKTIRNKILVAIIAFFVSVSSVFGQGSKEILPQSLPPISQVEKDKDMNKKAKEIIEKDVYNVEDLVSLGKEAIPYLIETTISERWRIASKSMGALFDLAISLKDDPIVKEKIIPAWIEVLEKQKDPYICQSALLFLDSYLYRLSSSLKDDPIVKEKITLGIIKWGLTNKDFHVRSNATSMLNRLKILSDSDLERRSVTDDVLRYLQKISAEHNIKNINELRRLFEQCKTLEIDFPNRFNKKTLREILNNREVTKSDGRPLAIIISPKSDWNEALIYSHLYDDVTLRYRLMYYEVDTDEAFIQSIKEGARDQAASLIIIQGHGVQHSVQLGYGGGERYFLDISDEVQLKEEGISNFLDEDGQIILGSCSTGQGKEEGDNVANFLRRIFPKVAPGSIWAPVVPGMLQGVGYNEQGKVEPHYVYPPLEIPFQRDQIFGAQVSHVKNLDRLLRILNVLRKSESVAEVSENASDREIIEFCIRELRAQGLIEETVDEDGNRIIKIKKEAENSRLAQAIRQWAIDPEGGVQAINLQGTDGTWIIIGFESELDNKDTLEHEQREVALRKEGRPWKEAHNQIVAELGVGGKNGELIEILNKYEGQIEVSQDDVARYVPEELKILFEVAKELGLTVVITGGTARDFAIAAHLKRRLPMPVLSDIDIAIIPEDGSRVLGYGDWTKEKYELLNEELRKRDYGYKVDFSAGIRTADTYVFENFLNTKSNNAFGLNRLAVAWIGSKYIIFGTNEAINDLKNNVLSSDIEKVEPPGKETTAKMIGKAAIYRDFADFSMDNYLKESILEDVNLIESQGKGVIIEFMKNIFEYMKVNDKNDNPVERLRKTIREFDLSGVLSFPEEELIELAIGKTETQREHPFQGPGGIDVSTGSPSTKTPGGIDFRSLPIITQPRQPSLGTVPLGAEVSPLAGTASTANLDKEWQEIQNMLNAGMVPSSQRIKDYLHVCYQKKDFSQDIEKILSCITDILRLEEERVSQTEPALKELLVLLESDKPASEMRISLAQITILPGVPKPVNP